MRNCPGRRGISKRRNSWDASTTRQASSPLRSSPDCSFLVGLALNILDCEKTENRMRNPIRCKAAIAVKAEPRPEPGHDCNEKKAPGCSQHADSPERHLLQLHGAKTHHEGHRANRHGGQRNRGSPAESFAGNVKVALTDLATSDDGIVTDSV